MTTLTTGEGSELEKKLAEQTHAVTVFAEQAVQMKEMLQVAERKAEEAEEKWKAWAEKEAQVKALPVETVTIATQTDHIEEVKPIQVVDGTQTEVALEEL